MPRPVAGTVLEDEVGIEQDRLHLRQQRIVLVDVSPARLHHREPPAQLIQRLSPLRLGFGVDQVGHAFGLGQVQLAVLEGPPGELPGLGQPQAQAAQRPAERIHHGRAAVHVKLGGVLAGVAGRPGKPEHEGAVDLPPLAVEERPQRRMARLRQAAGGA